MNADRFFRIATTGEVLAVATARGRLPHHSLSA
jgi:hypothetical protein